MKISFVGAGKLGFPCMLAAASRGHDAVGYDSSPAAAEIMASHSYPHREEGAQELLESTTARIVGSVREAVEHGDLILIAVQTPHQPEFEGLNRMPAHRSDFSYEALKAAVTAVAEEARALKKFVVVDVISTCLPGSIDREVLPLLNEYVDVVYSPYFIAMGSTVSDFLKPEFVLIGVGRDSLPSSVELVREFYSSISSAPHRVMSVASAELTKVAYNVFLGLKIVAANSVMEIAHKTPGANCDDVTDALALATERVISRRYMRGGGGDSGGCFVEGELIHVEDGVKAIDEIEKGDRALGADGKYHNVLEIYRRPYKGEVVTLKGRGLTRFTVTLDHPVHVARDLRPIKADGRRDQNQGPVLGPVEQLPASEVTTGYYIAFPTPRGESRRDFWTPKSGKSGPAPRPVYTYPHEAAYVLIAGYYMGEGSIWFDRQKNNAPSRVNFYFNTATDGDYIAECVEALRTVAPDSAVTTRKTNERESCTEVRVNSSQLAKHLEHDCGRGYEDKRVPAWILNSDDYSAACLRALFRGDGSSHVDGLSFSTVSPHLAHGVALMLRRHGIPSTLQFNPKRTGADGVTHRAAYDLGVNNAAYIEKLVVIVGMPIRHQMQEKRYPNTIFERDGVWYHKVNLVERSNYEGTVYNINVDDVHNYVSVGGLVNNCHPRDQIALSWLAEKLDLSYDLFGSMVAAREQQTEWLAQLAESESRDGKLPIVVLGKAYKRGTNLTLGSYGILLKNILDEYPHFEVFQWDPHVDVHPDHPDRAQLPRPWAMGDACVFVVATDHDEFYAPDFRVPANSVVIDPWGKFADREGIKVVRVGRNG